MKTIKPILKGILLYTTMIIILIFVASVDSLSNVGLLTGIAIVVALIYACKKAKVTI